MFRRKPNAVLHNRENDRDAEGGQAAKNEAKTTYITYSMFLRIASK